MQRLIWTEIAPRSRLQNFNFLTCEENGELVLAAVVRLTRILPRGYFAAILRGPVFSEISALQRSILHVKDALRNAGVVTMMVNPAWYGADAAAVCATLQAAGLSEAPAEIVQMYSVTGIVNLEPSESEIFEALKYRCRRHIRRAEKFGLKIRSARDEADAKRFRDLFRGFSTSKGYEVEGLPDLVDQWRYVQAEGGVFDLAEKDGNLIGGLVVLGEGRRATLKTLASLPILPKLPRSYSLLWEAIRKLKAQGYHQFDLGGLSADTRKDGNQEGRDFFKLAFNPEIVRFVPVHYVPLQPLRHALLFQLRRWYKRFRLARYLNWLLRSERRDE